MRRLVVVGILICVAWCAPVFAGDKVKVAEKGKTNIEAISKNLGSSEDIHDKFCQGENGDFP
jgi:hypothetical protein